ncbi:MAG: rRNA maturation RNase YbeY [Pelagimonas sp.]|jgi:probable rRNA maturation factor|nr:rRNA maturation RNase YbeY [Pelagimonas sp.]
MLTDTIIEDERWVQAGLAAHAETAARATLTHLGLDCASHEICVMGCDDTRIAALNADFRGKPQPTNVLSWPSEDLAAEEAGDPPFAPTPEDEEDPHHLGDIAIAFETCTGEAQEQGKSFASHVTHLLVHGTLHLLGYDHIRDADATLMEQIEVEILGKLGHEDPYRKEIGPDGS